LLFKNNISWRRQNNTEEIHGTGITAKYHVDSSVGICSAGGDLDNYVCLQDEKLYFKLYKK